MKKTATKKEPKPKALRFTDHLTYWVIRVEESNGELDTIGPFLSVYHARGRYAGYRHLNPNVRLRIIERGLADGSETIIESSDNA